jgi:hypothetical protein
VYGERGARPATLPEPRPAPSLPSPPLLPLTASRLSKGLLLRGAVLVTMGVVVAVHPLWVWLGVCMWDEGACARCAWVCDGAC